MRVGLTGGIASGKSTVAQFLVELGAVLIDGDALAREVVARGTPGLAQVVEEFGEELLTAGGRPRPAGAGPDRLLRRVRPPPPRGDHPPADLRAVRRARGGRAARCARRPRHPAAGRVGAGRHLRRGHRGRRPRRAAGRADDARPRLDPRGGRVPHRRPGLPRGPAGHRDVRHRRTPAPSTTSAPGSRRSTRAPTRRAVTVTRQPTPTWAQSLSPLLGDASAPARREPPPASWRRLSSLVGPLSLGSQQSGRWSGRAQAARSGSAMRRSFCSASRSSWRTRSAEMPCLAPMSASLCCRPSVRP